MIRRPIVPLLLIGLGVLALVLAKEAFSPFMARLLVGQHALRSEMASLLRNGNGQGHALLLFGSSVAYGFLHAIGPGHGKALACAYMLHGGKRLRDGLLFGNVLAFTHATSGVFTVLLIRYILELRFSRAMAETIQATSRISFGLVALIGLGLLVSGFRKAWNPPTDPPFDVPATRGPILTAITLGIIPCPAVVTVLLLCLGLQALPTGLLMAFGIGLGMALTLSAVVLLLVGGKVGSGLTRKAPRSRIPGLLSMASGTLLVLMATWFLHGLGKTARFL